ncbi:MAG: hypothetical protein ABEJ03_01445 [Candidatus Nanohaloarchaea archaeon]
MLLEDIGYLVTQNGSREVIQDVDLRTEGSRIDKIGDLDPSEEETIIDCSQKASCLG